MNKTKRDCIRLIERKGLDCYILPIGGVDRLITPGKANTITVISWERLYAIIEAMPENKTVLTQRQIKSMTDEELAEFGGTKK